MKITIVIYLLLKHYHFLFYTHARTLRELNTRHSTLAAPLKLTFGRAIECSGMFSLINLSSFFSFFSAHVTNSMRNFGNCVDLGTKNNNNAPIVLSFALSSSTWALHCLQELRAPTITNMWRSAAQQLLLSQCALSMCAISLTRIVHCDFSPLLTSSKHSLCSCFWSMHKQHSHLFSPTIWVLHYLQQFE